MRDCKDRLLLKELVVGLIKYGEHGISAIMSLCEREELGSTPNVYPKY
jgi:hypothetical protein